MRMACSVVCEITFRRAAEDARKAAFAETSGLQTP
jgi:hypothetical protein